MCRCPCLKLGKTSVKIIKDMCQNCRHCKVGLRACNNLPQPPPYILMLQCLLVSTVFGTVSSLHLTRFLHLLLLVFRLEEFHHNGTIKDTKLQLKKPRHIQIPSFQHYLCMYIITIRPDVSIAMALLHLYVWVWGANLPS